MVQLMTRYLEYEKQEEEVKIVEGCRSSSPNKKKGKTLPSPSRVPKASVQLEIDSIIAQSKVAGPFEMDSLVNFLEVSQRKRISKAKLPPMHTNPVGTPTHKIKQDYDMEIVECSKFNTPIRMVGRK